MFLFSNFQNMIEFISVHLVFNFIPGAMNFSVLMIRLVFF